MSDFIDGPAGLRRHIVRKRDLGELDRVIATRMLAALDGGADPDYMSLHAAAMHQPLPSMVFHTTRPEHHGAIAAEGLRPHLPAEGTYGFNAAGQDAGVYACAAPDLRGVWADGPRWQVWAISTAGRAWEPDPLNRDCWFTREPVPASALTLLGEFGAHIDISRLSGVTGNPDSRETSEGAR